MKKCLLFVAALFFVAAVSSPLLAEDKPLPKPEVLSEETILTGTRLSTYETIIIRDFKMQDAKNSNIDDEERPKLDNLKPMLVRNVTDGLEMELKNRKLFKSIQKNTEPKGKTLVVEGEFTEFNGGNRAIRAWVGFGAGKTYLKVRGRLLDGETGKELAVFEDRETGYKGSFSMENFVDLFPHQAKSLGVNLAEFIQKLY